MMALDWSLGALLAVLVIAAALGWLAWRGELGELGGWLTRHRWWLLLGPLGLLVGVVLSRRSRPEDEDTEPSGSRKELAKALRPRLEARASEDLARSRQELIEAAARQRDAEKEAERVRTAPDDELLRLSREYAERKRRAGPTVALLGVLLTAGTTRAQDALPAAVNIEPMAHPSTGEPGYWVAPWLWREALADARALPHCLAGGEVAARAGERAHRAADEREDVITLETLRRIEAEQRADEAERQRDAWYRSPEFLFTGGVAVGVLVAGLVALLTVRVID